MATFFDDQPVSNNNTPSTQDDATGVDTAVLTQNGMAQDDATGVDTAVLTQNGLAQDDATGVDNQVLLQQDEFGANFDQVVASGIAQDDAAGFSTGSIYDKVGTPIDIADPSAARLRAAGLLKGGGLAAKKTDIPVIFDEEKTGTIAHDVDWRVRITLADQAKIFYKSQDANNGIMSPLINTGVIFPYTPQITVTHQATYQSQRPTHANYQNYFYESSEVQQIQITGDFTVQNIDEGRYVLAVIYFFRSATKMFFGADELAGMPPPLVFLDGYGSHYFPHVSCVVTSFSHTMPADVDYLEIPSYYNGRRNNANSTRIPLASQITVTLQPVYSRKNIYNNFSLDDFAKGTLVKGRGGFI